METSPLISPLLRSSLRPHYDLLRRYHPSPEPAEVVWVPPPPEPNFRIDDLLDFSNGELCEELTHSCVEETPAEEDRGKEGGNGGAELNYVNSGQEASQQTETSGLCVPPDELADQLEWLSAFNEDSSYSGDRQLASLVSSGSLGGLKDEELPRPLHDDKFQSSSPISVLEPSGVFYANPFSFMASTSSSTSQHVPSRARSKRARIGERIWSLDSLTPTLFDTRDGRATAVQDSCVFLGRPHDAHEHIVPSKKAKKAIAPLVEAPVRRCSHCLVQKTPQWRAGPMGPKTLCNACGVRYKSGRLVPEYRPAGSPSFVNEVHSNSHKRILEMRRMKEMEEHVGIHKEEEDEEEDDSDCFSQTESCKEDPIHRIADTNSQRDSFWANPNCKEKEDAMGSICSEKEEDAMGSICSEKEDPAGSICNEKEDSIEPVSAPERPMVLPHA